MHLGKAIHRARKLSAERNQPMAVVKCGCGHYTVKRYTLAIAAYPADVRTLVEADGRLVDWPLAVVDPRALVAAQVSP